MNEPIIEGFNPAEIEGTAAENERLRAENETLQAQIKELQEKVAKLELLSTHDQLTGLLNRRGGLEKIELVTADMTAGANRKHEKQASQKEVSFLMLDIDRFKKTNDDFGHEAGDAVLKAVASFLTNTFRKYDVVSRWGGEEFLVTLQASAQDVINKFFNEKYRVEQYRGQNIPQLSLPVEINTKGGKEIINITLSGGAADYHAGEKFDDAIKRADEMLYKSKNTGRNRILKFEEQQETQRVPAKVENK